MALFASKPNAKPPENHVTQSKKRLDQVSKDCSQPQWTFSPSGSLALDTFKLEGFGSSDSFQAILMWPDVLYWFLAQPKKKRNILESASHDHDFQQLLIEKLPPKKIPTPLVLPWRHTKGWWHPRGLLGAGGKLEARLRRATSRS